ncbi:UNC5C-like protein [Branchiostoma floridae x Branchiostoma belcheri]
MLDKAVVAVFFLLILSVNTVNPQLQTTSPPDPAIAIASATPTPGPMNNINTILLLVIAVCVVLLAIPILIVTLIYVCNRRATEVSLPTVELVNVQQPAEMTTQEDRHTDLELFNKLCSDFSNFMATNLSIQLQTNYSSTNFAAGVFDHTGGHLSVPRHDVNLFIPPGAIEVGQRQTIHIFVPPSMNHGKPAPIVHCGPTGTTFRDHVILTFPVDHDDEIVPKFTNTDEGSVEDWQSLLEDGDAASIVKNGKCTLFISHFTGFGAEAKDQTSASKVKKDDKKIVRVGAFASKHTPDDRIYQMRIRFYDASAEASERMYHKELSQFGGRLLDDDKRMQVEKCDVAVRLRVSRIAAGWRTMDESDKNQRVEVSQLWDGSDETDATCTVRLEKTDPAARMADVWATVSVWQEASRGSTVTLKPSDTFQMSPRSDPPRGCLSPTQAFLHQQEELRPCGRPVPLLPLDVRHEMCVLLDVEQPGGNDWRMMAEKLEIDSPTIRWIGRNKSPTSKLLDFWETQNVSGGAVALQRLCDLYEEMERPDVRELAENVLSSEELSDSGYGDSDSRSPSTHGGLRASTVNILSDPFPENYTMNAPLKTMTLLDV